MARASRSLATFAQAISSTMSVTPPAQATSFEPTTKARLPEAIAEHRDGRSGRDAVLPRAKVASDGGGCVEEPEVARCRANNDPHPRRLSIADCLMPGYEPRDSREVMAPTH